MANRKPRTHRVCIGVDYEHVEMSDAALKKFPDFDDDFDKMSKARLRTIASALLDAAHRCVKAHHSFTMKYVCGKKENGYPVTVDLKFWIKYKADAKGNKTSYFVVMELWRLQDFGDHGEWKIISGKTVELPCNTKEPCCSK